MNDAKLNIMNMLLNAQSPKSVQIPGATDASLSTDDLPVGGDESANPFDMLFDAALNLDGVKGSLGKNSSSEMNLIGLDADKTDTLLSQRDIISSMKLNISNEYIKSLMDDNQVQIADGRYNVEGVKFTDSKLELSLLQLQNVSGENSKAVKIQVPLDALKIDKDVLAQLQNRIELNPVLSKVDGLKIQELLEKLNLKQIEIKGLDSNVSNSQLKDISIALIGEDKGNKVVLNNSLKRNQIQVTNKSNNVHAGSAEASYDIEPEQQSIDVATKGKASLMNSEFGRGQSSLQKNNLIQNTQVQAEALKLDAQLTSIGTESQSVDGQTSESSKSVRMQLPESIKTVLRPNGQAVTIKIDPENLGPAKLSLKFTNNKLTAHLTVHSVHAKNLLDHSIERLVDQLHKVDINVEKIDITLDNNQNEQNEFARNASWQRKFSIKNLRDNEELTNEQNQMIIPEMMRDKQYVSSTGVNLLA